MSEINEVIPESPEVVKGGPLDPTSPEGKPPEGVIVGENPAAPAAPEEPLYRGLTGDLKTTDDLKAYAKNLEDLFVQAKAGQALQSHASPVQPPTQSSGVQGSEGPSAKDKFSELIYSKPDEAYELTVSEAKRQFREELEQERRLEKEREQFWQGFYEKHNDLKNYQDIVQSIVKAHGTEISQIKTSAECAEFISKETRKLVDIVKKHSGVKETQLPSGPAVSLGGTKEVPARPAPQSQAPVNFISQVLKSRPRQVGKK